MVPILERVADEHHRHGEQAEEREGVHSQGFAKSSRIVQSGPGPPAHDALQVAMNPAMLRSSALSSLSLARTAAKLVREVARFHA